MPGIMSDAPRPLDENLYALDESEIQLLKSRTGITDEEELRKHVLKVQADIFAVSISILCHIMCQLYASSGVSIQLHPWFSICTVRAMI